MMKSSHEFPYPFTRWTVDCSNLPFFFAYNHSNSAQFFHTSLYCLGLIFVLASTLDILIDFGNNSLLISV